MHGWPDMLVRLGSHVLDRPRGLRQVQAAFMTEAEQVLVISQVCRRFIAVRRTVFSGKSMQPAVNHSHFQAMHGETQRGLVIYGH